VGAVLRRRECGHRDVVFDDGGSVPYEIAFEQLQRIGAE
jgi:hypothetical protein